MSPLTRVPLPRRIADAAGLTMKSAVVLHSLEIGGPADKAGLKVGDVLIALDGRPVDGAGTLLRMLDADAIGRDVTLTVLRNGHLAHLAVRPAHRPGARLYDAAGRMPNNE